MILSKDILKRAGACASGIKFCETNKLLGFPLSRLNEITGDHDGFVKWLKQRTFDIHGNVIRVDYSNKSWATYQYDSNNNLIRIEDSDDYWETNQYDLNNNLIRFHDSNGLWRTHQYDTNNNLIRTEDSNGYWDTSQYDSNNNLIRIDDLYECVETNTIEYYDNGQLKRFNALLIPQF